MATTLTTNARGSQKDQTFRCPISYHFVRHRRGLPKGARILVIGCSGGGKTTLSRALGTNYDLPYVSLDRDVRWLPGWVSCEKEAQRDIISKLVRHERWIMDGTSPSSFDLRLPHTDLVLWVRVPRRTALLGLFVRIARHRGTTRPDMAEGCRERLPDRDFLSYIWNFEKKSVPSIVVNLDAHDPKTPVLVLGSRREIDGLVSQ